VTILLHILQTYYCYFAEAASLVDNSEYYSSFCSVLESTIGEQYASFLTLVTESPNTGSGPVKSVIAACFAKLSAISFPSMLLCPGFHKSRTQF